MLEYFLLRSICTFADESQESWVHAIDNVSLIAGILNEFGAGTQLGLMGVIFSSVVMIVWVSSGSAFLSARLA